MKDVRYSRTVLGSVEVITCSKYVSYVHELVVVSAKLASLATRCARCEETGELFTRSRAS